jgi:hypothetical protein
MDTPVVTYVAHTGQFSTAWYRRTNNMIDFRLVNPNGALGPLDLGHSFGGGAGEPQLAYNAYSQRSVLLTKAGANADFVALELGDNGYPVAANPIVLTGWDGRVLEYRPALATSTKEARFVATYVLTAASQATLIQATNLGSPPPPPPPPPPPTDTDGDGVPDSQDSCPTVFAQTSNGCPPVQQSGVSGDFNADGMPELVWQNVNAPGQVYAWFLTPNYAFSSGAYLANENVAPGWTVAGTGDFTGDGKPDVLWQNQQTGEIYLFIMNGATKIGEQSLGISPAWRVVATADMNKDGKTDIIWQNFATGQIYVWYMTSNGTSASAMNPFQGSYILDANLNPSTLGPNDRVWRVVGVADMNGDGKPDLIWQHPTGALSAWYLNGVVYAGSIDVPFNDPAWKLRGVGDYNRDGHPDLAFWNASTGDTEVWIYTSGTSGVGFTRKPVARVSTVWNLMGPR